MKDLIIGDVEELFSKKDLDNIVKDYGFPDRSLVQDSLNKLYGAYKMYSTANPSSTRKDVRKAYKAMSLGLYNTNPTFLAKLLNYG